MLHILAFNRGTDVLPSKHSRRGLGRKGMGSKRSIHDRIGTHVAVGHALSPLPLHCRCCIRLWLCCVCVHALGLICLLLQLRCCLLHLQQ